MKPVTLLLILLLMQTCNNPQAITDSLIVSEDLIRDVVRTDIFEHRIFHNQKPIEDVLHVYIDGDGSPWIGGVTPAKDPTPRNPMVLRMLARDERAAVYLGRPCYHEAGPADRCGSEVWTSQRYSGSVVDSMEAALVSLAEKRENPDLVLIGYSGGAVIATLLAQRMPRVVGLLTVAGNLDTRLWTETLGLLPLTGSSNPVDLTESRVNLHQLHLAGGNDNLVPLLVTKSYVDRHGGELEVYPDFDHNCCWEDAWGEILTRIESFRGENISPNP